MKLLENHVTIYEFAKLKRVYPNNVYAAIKDGKINVDLVGMGETRMIDLNKYKDYRFKDYPNKKNKIEEFFDYSEGAETVTNKKYKKRYDKR